MSAATEDRHKSRPITFRLDDGRRKLLDGLMQKSSLTQTQAVNAIFDGFLPSGLHNPTQRTPEKCNLCLKCAGEVENGVVCLTKKSSSDPINFKRLPFAIAEKCAEMPFNTPVDKKTREQFEKDLQSAKQDLERETRLHDTYRKKYDKLKDFPEEHDRVKRKLAQVEQPFQDLLKEKEGLKVELGNVRNSLLEALNEKTVVETDNEFLRIENKKLSEQEILKENDSLQLQLKEMGSQKADIAEEVLKVQALLKEERNQKHDIISKVDKMLREIDQYMPRFGNQLSVSDIELKAYVNSLKKTIQNFRGYLSTVAS